jgi:hypothetical protein
MIQVTGPGAAGVTVGRAPRQQTQSERDVTPHKRHLKGHGKTPVTRTELHWPGQGRGTI